MAVLPVVRVAAPEVQDFVPQGWNWSGVDGDLTANGRAYKVLVFTQQDAAHWQDTQAWVRTFESEPLARCCVVEQPQGYRKQCAIPFLPSERTGRHTVFGRPFGRRRHQHTQTGVGGGFALLAQFALIRRESYAVINFATSKALGL